MQILTATVTFTLSMQVIETDYWPNTLRDLAAGNLQFLYETWFNVFHTEENVPFDIPARKQLTEVERLMAIDEEPDIVNCQVHWRHCRRSVDIKSQCTLDAQSSLHSWDIS